MSARRWGTTNKVCFIHGLHDTCTKQKNMVTDLIKNQDNRNGRQNKHIWRDFLLLAECKLYQYWLYQSIDKGRDFLPQKTFPIDGQHSQNPVNTRLSSRSCTSSGITRSYTWRDFLCCSKSPNMERFLALGLKSPYMERFLAQVLVGHRAIADTRMSIKGEISCPFCA